jgi:hypothetical protein
MVVSSAINDWSANVKNYFMLDAAVPTEAFYGQETKNQAMIPSSWNGYKESLRATEWYTLPAFTPVDPNTGLGDYRSRLTWRNRFTDGSLAAFYNFFSPDDDVLTSWWILQETLKGTVGILGYNNADYGGWGFNLEDTEYYVETQLPDGGSYRDPIPILEANLISDSALTTKPFFKKGVLIDSLLGAGGSDFAQTNRDRMLSESFPALTSAVGTNSVNNFDARNADMQLTYKTDIMQWPRGANGPWLHSDAKDVAYIHVYKLFKKFVDEGGLDQ